MRKEFPILYSAPMVRAKLAGTKTQTRRLVKPQPAGQLIEAFEPRTWELTPASLALQTHPCTFTCPYGQPGDLLWGREAWRPAQHNFPTGWPYEYRATAEEDGNPTDGRWKPSIHMPKVAARIWDEVVSVRVERLQDISEKDAIAEGIESEGGFYRDYSQPGGWMQTARASYRTLWESINGPGSWALNPWVWVIETKPYTKPQP